MHLDRNGKDKNNTINRPPKREFNPSIQVEIFKENRPESNRPIENTAMHTAVTLTNDDTKVRSKNILVATNLDSVNSCRWHSLVLGISIKSGSVPFPDRYDRYDILQYDNMSPDSVISSILKKKQNIKYYILSFAVNKQKGRGIISPS